MEVYKSLKDDTNRSPEAGHLWSSQLVDVRCLQDQLD